MGQAGFTLVEVLIAMVLLAFISLSIYQTTTQIYRRRDILQNEGDFYNGIRLAMGIMDRDVSAIYSPTIILPEKTGTTTAADAQDMQAILSSELGRSTAFWNPAVDKTGIRPSRFVGTETKMTFISISNVRIYRDAPESEFIKVTYELKEDPFRPVDDTNARVLTKTSNPSAFDDDDGRLIKSPDSRERTYPLLQGVKSLKFRYWRQDKERWENDWDSDSQDEKDLIPDKIEVALEVVGPTRLEFKGTYVMRTEIPLNGLVPSF